MKKTLTINLAGMVFHIDDDAFETLKNYLDRVKSELRSVDGGNEIYEDVEARISELFAEKLTNNKQVITQKEVDDIIRTMGQPGDISGNSESSRYESETYKKRYRRMYRDPDNCIIGGVCGGLAAYWRVDPTIVRIIFILLAIFGMAGVIIYLILWVVLPEAHTVAQKLEMRGESVNLSSIGDFFREEFNNVKNSFKKK
jgi:phage shock protein PspC (stress-responsive transcriptional regulator)